MWRTRPRSNLLPCPITAPPPRAYARVHPSRGGQALAEAGVSTAGAYEKEELVALARENKVPYLCLDAEGGPMLPRTMYPLVSGLMMESC